MGVFSKMVTLNDKTANDTNNFQIETKIENSIIIIDYTKLLKNHSFYFVELSTLSNLKNGKSETSKTEVLSIFSLKIEVVYKKSKFL